MARHAAVLPRIHPHGSVNRCAIRHPYFQETERLVYPPFYAEWIAKLCGKCSSISTEQPLKIHQSKCAEDTISSAHFILKKMSMEVSNVR